MSPCPHPLIPRLVHYPCTYWVRMQIRQAVEHPSVLGLPTRMRPHQALQMAAGHAALTGICKSLQPGRTR